MSPGQIVIGNDFCTTNHMNTNDFLKINQYWMRLVEKQYDYPGQRTEDLKQMQVKQRLAVLNANLNSEGCFHEI